MSLHVEIDRERIVIFCERYGISRLAFFGSVLTNDFRPDSDVDVLVSFADDARWSLFDLVNMQEELEDIMGRKVDLIEREVIEKSDNYIRRRQILQSEEIVYAADSDYRRGGPESLSRIPTGTSGNSMEAGYWDAPSVGSRVFPYNPR